MPDKPSYELLLDFGYDDVTQGLNAIAHDGQKVMKVFSSLAEGIEKAFGDFKRKAEPAVKTMSGFEREANRIFSTIEKGLNDTSKAMRQADMKSWEKAADNYESKIRDIREQMLKLEKTIESSTATEEERVKAADALLDAQKQVDQLVVLQRQHVEQLKQSEEERIALAERQRAAKKAAADQARQEREAQAAAAKEAKEQLRQQIQAEKELRQARMQQERQFNQGVGRVDSIAQNAGREASGLSMAMRGSGMKESERLAMQYEKRIEDINADLRQQQALLQSINMTQEQQEQSTKRIAEAQRQITILRQQQAAHVGMVRGQEADADKAASVARMNGALADMKSGLQDLVGIAAGLGAILTIALADAGKSYADYQSKLVAFRAISKASKEDLAAFRAEAEGLAVFGKNSKEVAQLGVELAKAGISAKDVTASLKDMTAASIAMQEDLIFTGESVDSIRTMFQIPIEELSRVTDGLTLTANESKVGMREIMESYKYLGPAAESTNQKLESMNTALVLLGNNGIKASMAGNALENTLYRLADKGVRDKLKAIGVDAIDPTTKKFRDFLDILTDLQKALQGVSEPNKAALMKDLFGEVALKGMMPLLNTAEAKIRETEKTMNNYNGTAERTAKSMQTGLQYSFNQLTASIMNAKHAFVEELEPTLNGIMDSVKGVVDGFTALPDPVKSLISNLTLFAAIASGAIVFLGGIGLGAAGAAIGLGQLASGFVLFTTGAAPAAAAGATVVGKAFASMGAALKLLPGLFAGVVKSVAGFVAANPVILRFIALAGSLYAAWKLNLGGVRDLVEPALMALSESFRRYGDNFSIWGHQMSAAWTHVWESIKGTLVTALGFIDVTLRGLFDVVGVIFGLIFDVMHLNFGSAWETVSNITKSGAEYVLGVFSSFFKTLREQFSKGWGGLTEVAAGAWDILKDPANFEAGKARMLKGLSDMADAVKNVAGSIGQFSISSAIGSQVTAMREHGYSLLDIDAKLEEVNKRRAKTRADQLKKKPPAAVDPLKDKSIEKLLEDKNSGKSQGEKELDKWIKDTESKYDGLIAKDAKKIESDKAVGKSTEELGKKIAQTALSFSNSKDALNFQKAVQGIGRTCAATSDHILKLAGVTKNLQGVVRNKNWVPDYDALIKAGYATKVALDDIRAGDLVLGYSPDPRSQRGHIGVAIDNKRVVHASSQAAKGRGVRQLSAVDTIRNAFSESLKAGDDVHGLRFTEKAYKEGLVGISKEAMLTAQTITRLQQKRDEFHKKGQEILAKYGRDSAEYRKIQENVVAVDTELTKAKTKGIEQAQKEAEEKKKNEREAGEAILKIAEENYSREIELSNDAMLKLEMQRDGELEQLEQRKLKELEKFKGTEDQRKLLLAEYADAEALLRAKHGKIIAEAEYQMGLDKNKIARELESAKVELMEEGFAKQNRLIELNLEAQKEEYDTRLRALRLDEANNAKEIEKIEAIKALAVESAERRKQRAREESILKQAELNSRLQLMDLPSDVREVIETSKAYSEPDIPTNPVEMAGYLENVANAKALEIDALRKQMSDPNKGLEDRIQLLEQINTLELEAIGLYEDAAVLQDEAFQAAVLQDEQRAKSLSRMHQMNSSINSAAAAAAQVASIFGEWGRNIGAAIQTASSFITGMIEIINDPSAFTPEKAMSLAVQAGIVYWSAIGEMISSPTAFIDREQKSLDRMAKYAREKELEIARDKLEIRKRNGENVLAEELSLIDRETAERIRSIQDQIKEVEDAPGSWLLGLWETTEDKDKKREQTDKLKQELDKVTRDAEKSKEQVQYDAEKKRQSNAEELARINSERQITLAKLSGNRLSEIHAEHVAAKEQLDQKYQKLVEDGVLTEAEAKKRKAEEALVYDREAQAKAREELARSNGEKLAAENAHKRALLELGEDSYDKSLELLKLEAKDTDDSLAAARDAYELNSEAWKKAEQERVDASKAANKRILDFEAEAARERARTLARLRGDIAALQASLSDGSADDLQVELDNSLRNLREQEEDEIREARAKYKNSEEIVTQIRTFYALEREKKVREIAKNGAEALRKEYEDEQEKLFQSQNKELIALIEKDEKRLKAIQRQTDEYERQLKAIDDIFNLEKERAEAQDKVKFDQALSGLDITKLLEDGANYLTNEDIINGGILDRTSLETQILGLKEMLKYQAQDAESKRKLEDITEAQYVAEMLRITEIRGRALQLQQEQATTDKEKSDLLKEYSDTYVEYQSLMMEDIEARRKEEKKATEELLKSNNKLRDQTDANLTKNKLALEDLEAVHRERLSAINTEMANLKGTSDAVSESLKKWAPALAEQVTSLLDSVSKVRQALAAPFDPAKIGSGYFRTENGVYSGPDFSPTPTATHIVSGNRGYYTTTSARKQAEGFATGGVTPDDPRLDGDRGLIRVTRKERVLTDTQNRFFEASIPFLQRMAQPAAAYGGDSWHITVARDVDLNKLDNVLDKHLRKRGSEGSKRRGISGVSRI